MSGRRLALGAFTLVCALCALPSGAGTLDRIKESGKIRLGHRADARPFSFVDESGRPAGYSVELCGRIVDAVKAELGLGQLQVEWVKVDSEDRFDAVESGQIDLLCGAATITLGRRKQVAFSIPVFSSGVSALVRADSPERLRAVLEGRAQPYRARWRANLAEVLEKRVLSAQKGTTTASWLAKRADALEVKAVLVDVSSYQEGVNRVLSGESDAFFADRAILLDAVARSPKAGELLVLDRQYTNEPIGLASAKGDDDFRLVVDKTLSGVYRSGQIWDVYQRYFGKGDEAAQSFFRIATLPE